MELLYHGTTKKFKNFDISHACEGDGKIKFGLGAYVTESYDSAALYSHNKSRPNEKDHYVITFEAPDLTKDNHLSYNDPIHPSIIKRTEEKLGEKIPDEVKALAKHLRKYVGNRLTGRKGAVKQLYSKSDFESEKAATKFFSEIGLEYYIWPINWKNPTLTNRAVLNADKLRVVRIDKVELNPKDHKLIEGSQKEIPLDSF